MEDTLKVLYRQVIQQERNRMVQYLNDEISDTLPIHQNEEKALVLSNIFEEFNRKYSEVEYISIALFLGHFKRYFKKFSTGAIFTILEEAEAEFTAKWINQKSYHEDNYARIFDLPKERLTYELAYYEAWSDMQTSYRAKDEYDYDDVAQSDETLSNFPTKIVQFKPCELLCLVEAEIKEHDRLETHISSFKKLKSKQYNKTFIEIYSQLYYNLKAIKCLGETDETKLKAHLFDCLEVHPINWTGYLFQLIYLLDQLHKMGLLINDFDGRQDNIASKKIVQHFYLNGKTISERQILNERVNNVERISSNKNAIIRIDTILQNILG